MGRLASGALVTLNACGTGDPVMPLGHPRLHDRGDPAHRASGASGWSSSEPAPSRLRKVRSVADIPVWEQFLNVRAGRVPNPSPPEVGLRMARLWDAIRESAARGGAVDHEPDGGPAAHAATTAASWPARSDTRSPDDTGHGLERVPPGRRGGRGPSGLSGRHPRGDRRWPARRRVRRPDGAPSTSRITA